jgi:hypothetical protein
MRRRWAIAGSIAALAIQASLARAPESLLPIEVSLPVAPIPVRAAGASHLFYELHLTNFRNAPLELTRVDVYAGGAEGSLVASYSGQDISDRLLRPGAPRMQDKRTLGGGRPGTWPATRL